MRVDVSYLIPRAVNLVVEIVAIVGIARRSTAHHGQSIEQIRLAEVAAPTRGISVGAIGSTRQEHGAVDIRKQLAFAIDAVIFGDPLPSGVAVDVIVVIHFEIARLNNEGYDRVRSTGRNARSVNDSRSSEIASCTISSTTAYSVANGASVLVKRCLLDKRT